jgi:hypothetical protein
MIQGFQEMQNANSNLNDLEQRISHMNIKNLELTEQAQKYKGKYQEIVKISQEMEEAARMAFQEKEIMENDLRRFISESQTEKGFLQNALTSLENEKVIILEEMQKLKDEFHQRIAEFFEKENEFKFNLDSAIEQNMALQQKIDKLEEEKTDEILQIESILDQERARYEVSETERQKIQEEYDTLNQTLNYTASQLAEKKKICLDLQSKVL